MATSHKAELALELGLAMNEMKSLLRQRIQAKINECDPDLSFELLEIIGVLWRNNGINQQEIADRVSKDKSSMTYLINSLVKRKLVKRVEAGHDRRHKLIFLTKKGKEVRKEIYPSILAFYERAVADTSLESVKTAIDLVKKMTNNLE